jgi:MFS family permease
MTRSFEETPYRSPEQPGLTERPTWIRWHVVALLMGYSFMTWFNRVSMEAAGAEIIKAETLTKTQVGTVYSSFFLCYTIFMTPGGWFSDRFGPRAALLWMGFGSALFCAGTGLVGLVATSPAMLLGLLQVVRGVMGAFTAPVYPSSGRMVAHWLPLASRAWANGLVLGAASLGTASAYLVFSWRIEWFDWPASFQKHTGPSRSTKVYRLGGIFSFYLKGSYPCSIKFLTGRNKFSENLSHLNHFHSSHLSSSFTFGSPVT